MARTKRGVTSRAKHNKVLKTVKGQYGRRKNTIRIARQAINRIYHLERGYENLVQKLRKCGAQITTINA